MEQREDKYQELFDSYIEHRKDHPIDESHLDESYKWKLVTDCQGMNAMSIAERVRKGNENLIYGYAKGNLKWAIDNHPHELQAALEELLGTGAKLPERLAKYNQQIKDILKDYNGRKSLQDERSASVFLTCYNPQRYTFYIHSLYKDFCDYLGYDVKLTLECYPHYLDLLCPLEEMVKAHKPEIDKITASIDALVHSDLLVAQDIIWDFFVKNKQGNPVPPTFVDSLIKRIKDDNELVVGKKGNKFVWIETKDGKIGNSECHYEFCWEKNLRMKGTRHDGKTVFAEVHFEKKSLVSEQYAKLFENDERIKRFNWQSGVPALRLNDDGYKFSDYAVEDLVDKLVDEMYQLDSIVRPEIEKIKDMEKELEAIEPYKKLLESNHNLIFTGAPGTGKTFLAKRIAAAMIECKKEDLTKSEQYAFVQFHPSYDYTDFVEGLKPKADGDGFERKDGIFKKFCERALNSQNPDSFASLYNALLQDIKDSDDFTVKMRNGSQSQPLTVNENDNIRWQGATGDSLAANMVSKKRMYKLFQKYPSLQAAQAVTNITSAISNVIGGCNTSYYWAILIELLSRKTELSIDNRKYVFVIDEINRGELSKIFGELFYSIEPGYRGKDGAVLTQYSNLVDAPNSFDLALGTSECGHFFIPENVYIIGTMNDIDRSVESMDFAMRRRFAWNEIDADDTMDDILDNEFKDKTDIPLQDIKDHIIRLNERIGNFPGLGHEYQIGSAYFLKYKQYGNFEDLWNYHLRGVLYEYLRGNRDAKGDLQKLKNAYDGVKDEDETDEDK